MSEPTPLLAPIKPALVAPRVWTDAGFAADRWRLIGDDEALPQGAPVIVSLPRWRRERATLVEVGRRVGLGVQPADHIELATDDIGALALIVLHFPKFTDGRAYSTARQLRDAGFQGDVRATGDVLLDQLPLMLRSGFSSFEIANAATIAALEQGARPDLLPSYQQVGSKRHITSAT